MSIQTELEARNVKLQGILDDTNAAITAKGGTQAATLSGLPEAVGGISGSGGGEEIFYTTYRGAPYLTRMIIPDGNYAGFPNFRGADKMEHFEINNSNALFSDSYALGYCTNLKTAILNGSYRLDNNNREFQACTSLESVQFGGLGRPISVMNNGNIMAGCSQTGLEVTIYVNAATLADIPGTISGSPWGAGNATIIYRNSATGEVITE